MWYGTLQDIWYMHCSLLKTSGLPANACEIHADKFFKPSSSQCLNSYLLGQAQYYIRIFKSVPRNRNIEMYLSLEDFHHSLRTISFHNIKRKQLYIEQHTNLILLTGYISFISILSFHTVWANKATNKGCIGKRQLDLQAMDKSWFNVTAHSNRACTKLLYYLSEMQVPETSWGHPHSNGKPYLHTWHYRKGTKITQIF